MSSYFMGGVRDARHPPIQNDDAAFTSIPVDRNDDLTFDKSSSTDHDDDADLVFLLSIARLHGRTSSNTVPRFLGFVKNTLYQTSRCYRRMRSSGPTQWMCEMGGRKCGKFRLVLQGSLSVYHGSMQPGLINLGWTKLAEVSVPREINCSRPLGLCM